MTQRVKLPDGTIANFPDNISQEEIVSSIQRTFGTPKAESSVGKRFLEGVNDPIYGAAQIADRFLVDPIRQMISPGASNMQDVMRERDANLVGPEGVDWARMAGNVANPLNYIGPQKGVQPMAAAGMMQGVTQPTAADLPVGEFAQEKAIQMGVGGLIGGAVGGIPGAPAAARQGAGDTDTLMQAGIQPTFGQAAGPGSIVGRTEQAATSLPLVGDVITAARNRPVQEFGEWALREATGAPVKTLDQANQMARDAYEAVVPKLKADFDTYLLTDTAKTLAAGNPELTKGNKKLFLRVASDLNERILQIDDKGAALKHLDSEMGALIRKYDAGDPAQQTLADAFRTLQEGFRKGLADANPAEADALNAANAMYRKLVPLNKAASRRGDEMITPRNLQLELARQAGVDASRFSEPVVDAALRRIPSTVPDSGTASRSALVGALTGGAFTGGFALPMLAGLAATGGAYSRAGQSAMIGAGRAGMNISQRVLGAIEAASRPVAAFGRLGVEQGRQ